MIDLIETVLNKESDKFYLNRESFRDRLENLTENRARIPKFIV